MSNEIKVGDKVRVREDAPNLHPLGWDAVLKMNDSVVLEIEGDTVWVKLAIAFVVDNKFPIPTKYLVKVDAEAKEPKFKRGDKVVSKPPFVEKVWTVFGYDDKMPYMVMVGDGEYINERNLEPYTQPTEQSSAEKPFTDRATKLSEQTKLFLDIDGLIEPPFRTIPKIMFNTEFWVKYEANLAKEVALKVANKYNDPKEAAEYAVKVAKLVVEGLKKK